MDRKKLPNILITGTPGVGKSTISSEVCKRTGLEWLNIGLIAKENDCLEDYDEVYQCPILDEDKVLDLLEEKMSCGGKVVDYHSCELFPERWFNAVFVIRTNNTQLYDRLVSRRYSSKKLTDNIECEIFQMVLDEAYASYKPDIVFELQNDDDADLQRNIQTIINWIKDNR